MTFLLWAVESNHIPIIELLVEKYPTLVFEGDIEGATPLHYASLNGNLAAAVRLCLLSPLPRISFPHILLVLNLTYFCYRHSCLSLFTWPILYPSLHPLIFLLEAPLRSRCHYRL